MLAHPLIVSGMDAVDADLTADAFHNGLFGGNGARCECARDAEAIIDIAAKIDFIRTGLVLDARGKINALAEVVEPLVERDGVRVAFVDADFQHELFRDACLEGGDARAHLESRADRESAIAGRQVP